MHYKMTLKNSNMKNRIILSLLSILIWNVAAHAGSDPIGNGNAIFTAQCSGCHDVKLQVVGPALSGVTQRHDMDWIVKFVKSSQSLVKNNDKDAVDLFNKYNHIIMPDHPDMTEGDVKNIMAYINTASLDVGKMDQMTLKRPLAEDPPYHPLSLEKDYPVFLIYLGLTVIMLFCFLYLINLKEVERDSEKDK